MCRSRLTSLEDDLAMLKCQQVSPPVVSWPSEDEVTAKLRELGRRQSDSETAFHMTAQTLKAWLQRLETGMENMQVCSSRVSVLECFARTSLYLHPAMLSLI